MHFQKITLNILKLLFLTSCQGQVNNKPENKNIDQTQLPLNKTAIFPISTPKLIKTQGSGKFDKQYDVLGSGLQDKNGNLWFGTSREGLFRFDGSYFKQFTTKDGLKSNEICALIEDKINNYLWIGTKEAIIQFDGKTFKNIPLPTTTGNFIQPNNLPEAKNELWSMMQDKKGLIWLGTSNGIYCYDGKEMTPFLRNNIINKENLQLKWTQCILEDKNGNIWFGSWVKSNEGISKFDGKSITQYKPFGEGWIREIIETKNGDLLFATRHNGILKFDGKSFSNITNNAGIDKSSINTIFEDSKGNIWIGTELGSGELNEDGGIWRFDGKNFTKFTTENGLIHNGVFKIFEDKFGNIWIGTRNTGLSCYDGKTFKNFTV